MRVLLADDHADTREMLTLALERVGWEVFAAKDGRDALRIYHSEIEGDKYFDVLLLDVEMPRLNGFAVGVNVRNIEKFADVPKVPRACHIYLTGHDDVVPPEQLLETEFADAYIHKPIGPDELVIEIEKAMKEAEAASLP